MGQGGKGSLAKIKLIVEMGLCICPFYSKEIGRIALPQHKRCHCAGTQAVQRVLWGFRFVGVSFLNP